MASDNCGVRFPPKITTDKTCCSVYGCSSKAKTDTTVRFHRFPKFGQYFIKRRDIYGEIERTDRAKIWMNVLRITRNKTKNTVVCSLHFQAEDYLFPSKILSVSIFIYYVKCYNSLL